MDCKGPCLLHCYKKNSLLLILIGFLIGFFVSRLLNRSKINESNY